ncbi:MAG: hypothetical protein ACXAEF_01090 [Candidatus Thorarchaeota archaeon]
MVGSKWVVMILGIFVMILPFAYFEFATMTMISVRRFVFIFGELALPSWDMQLISDAHRIIQITAGVNLIFDMVLLVGIYRYLSGRWIGTQFMAISVLGLITPVMTSLMLIPEAFHSSDFGFVFPIPLMAILCIVILIFREKTDPTLDWSTHPG